MPDLVLYHVTASPFSALVRLVLGLKGLDWRSVAVPPLAYRQDLARLTGGYRKVPVLQIGADIYCDSQCIVRILERLCPRPTMHVGGAGAGYAFLLWATRCLHWSFFSASMALEGDTWPDMLREPWRAYYEIAPEPLEPGRLPVELPPFISQLEWLDDQLQDRDFLFGERPGLADFAAFVPVWAARRTALRLHIEARRSLVRWAQRVGELDHGPVRHLSTQDALRIAADAEPADAAVVDPNCGLGRGEWVEIRPADFGREPVRGRLVGASTQEIVVEHEAAGIGRVSVHFPRVGYHVVACPRTA